MTQFKDIVLPIIKDQVLKYAISRIPSLAFPILNPIASLIISKVLEVAFKETELAIYFLNIEALTKEQVDQFKKSQDALNNAKTDAEKTKAENEFKNNFNNLIKFKP